MGGTIQFNLACYEAQMASLDRAKAHLEQATEDRGQVQIDGFERFGLGTGAGIVGQGHSMKVIEVRPSRKFKDAWVAFEAPGVGPAFPDPNGKQDAIDYARGPLWRESRRDSRFTATTIQPSSAGSSSTVAASIREAAVIKTARYGRRGSILSRCTILPTPYGSDPEQ